MMVFSGTSNRELAEGVAEHLGVELGNVKISKFANGEIYVRFLESVRGADVFIIQSGCSPVNASVMELLIMVDAAKRASARSITAVITHYPYARQDKKSAAREPITARLVADLLTTAGVDKVIAMDLHQGQIQGFFNQPVNHLTALPILEDYFRSLGLEDMCVVSPDVGRVKVAKKLADMLGASLAIMHKGRPEHNIAEITHVIGEVAGKILHRDRRHDRYGGFGDRGGQEPDKQGCDRGVRGCHSWDILWFLLRSDRSFTYQRGRGDEYSSGAVGQAKWQDSCAFRGTAVCTCHPERVQRRVGV